MEVKLASQKWRQLQNKISQRINPPPKVIDLDRALLGVFNGSNNNLTGPPGISIEENKEDDQAEVHLPVLSGILRNTDIYGRAYATAVIDGRRYKENDRIQGFKIQKILKDGMIVTHSGQQWFISAPDVAYSKVHATGAKNNDSQ